MNGSLIGMAWLDTSDRIPQLLEAYRGPMLYMLGDDDRNVSGNEKTNFEKAFEGRSNTQVLGALPGLSHAFHRRDGTAEVGEAALVGLANWLGRGE